MTAGSKHQKNEIMKT